MHGVCVLYSRLDKTPVNSNPRFLHTSDTLTFLWLVTQSIFPNVSVEKESITERARKVMWLLKGN